MWVSRGCHGKWVGVFGSLEWVFLEPCLYILKRCFFVLFNEFLVLMEVCACVDSMWCLLQENQGNCSRN